MPKAKNKSNEQRVSQLNQKSKKLTKKKTKDKKNQTKVSLPNRPELISANWKALMTTISKKDTHKKGFQGNFRQSRVSLYDSSFDFSFSFPRETKAATK